MPYTGNLLQQVQQPDNPRRLGGVSPRHGAMEGDPAAPRGEHQVPSGTGSEYQRTDFPPVVMGGFGLQLDTPASWAGMPPGGPYESPYAVTYPAGNPHDSDAVLSAVGAAAQAVVTAPRAAAHDGAEDRGWWRTTFDPAPLFDARQPRAEIASEGLSNPFGGLTDDGVKYVRGINSRPENNPPRDGYQPGFRLGRDRWRVWDNDVFQSISRDLSPQILRPRDIYTPNPAQRMVDTMVVGPAIPRDPSAPDDQLTARYDYGSSPRSVFGGF